MSVKRIPSVKLRVFCDKIRRYYACHSRRLPWRPRIRISREHKSLDPYRILVSEVMLQQTQVERVLKKYPEFLRAFPTLRVLARAPLRRVLRVWSGLGYNRRAFALKRAAEIIVKEHEGRVPQDPETLKKLPGIGHATASALCAFAFNKPAVFIETNIRSVFLHFFFRKRRAVRDDEILPLIEITSDKRKPREWYYALMDYGSMLKKNHSNPSRKSAHHVRQSPFRGSGRELRGAVIRLLIKKSLMTEKELTRKLEMPHKKIRDAVVHLLKDGLIQKRGRALGVP